MSDPFDDQLRARLERLMAAIPVEPPSTGAGSVAAGAVRRGTRRAVLAAAALLVVVSLGAGAAFIALDQPEAKAGAFAAGGPLHCSPVDQMTPREAERWMAERGITARWQVEGAGSSSDHQDAAPERGFIISALALDDGTLLVLVDLERVEPLDQPCP